MVGALSKTPEKRAALQHQQQLGHDLHVRFFTAICLQQSRAGRYAHVYLKLHLFGLHALKSLQASGPPLTNAGSMELAVWILTTLAALSRNLYEQAVMQAMCQGCDNAHWHCQLESHIPVLGDREQAS